MKYLMDMLDKYGFNDGKEILDGMEDVRLLYIDMINFYAIKNNSEYRAYSFNRPGLHNRCMILFAKKPDECGLVEFEGDFDYTSDNLNFDDCVSLEDTDSAFRKAVDIAQKSDIDIYVHPGVYVDPDAWDDLGLLSDNEISTDDLDTNPGF